ncbi:hypothetical protein NQZ79_g8392 [Umbelopsis isabellina]|nr:hypothetical protein NQZ79_g8392 [Umbelopsis isabellina]
MLVINTLPMFAMMTSATIAISLSANGTTTKYAANDGLEYAHEPAPKLAASQHGQQSEPYKILSKCLACDGIPDCLAFCIEVSRQNPTCQECAAMVGPKKVDACLACMGVPV